MCTYPPGIRNNKAKKMELGAAVTGSFKIKKKG